MGNGRKCTHNMMVSVMILIGIGIASPAQAFFDPPADELLEETRISLIEAVERALQKVPGRAFEVEIEQEKGHAAFEVQIQDANGKRHEVYVDARNGQILTTESEGE